MKEKFSDPCGFRCDSFGNSKFVNLKFLNDSFKFCAKFEKHSIEKICICQKSIKNSSFKITLP